MAEKPEPEVIELALPARPEYVGIVRLTLSGIANRLGFTYDEIEDIKLAAGEACTNAVQHAYSESGGEGRLKVSCRLYPDRIVIDVADEGKGFPFSSVKETLGPLDPGLDIEDVAEGGLGLYLIHSLMDEVTVSTGAGVVVSMTKYRRRDEVASDDRACPQTDM
jgi:serine/threonine-protein kinase RsbW